MSEPDAFYVPLGGGRYRPTEHTQGAWLPGEQHMAPVSGLLVHELENYCPRADLALARVAFDIFGVIHRREFSITCRTIRPGRTIELVQADLAHDDRVAVRATAWRLATSDTRDLAAGDTAALPPLAAGTAWDGSQVWPGGFIASLDVRVLPGHRPGRGAAWLRSRVALVDGVVTSDQAALYAVMDTSNGIAVRADPRALSFPNTDLSVHVYRPPTGSWLGLDTSVTFGPDGVGLTESVLHDRSGPFGRSAQILTLRKRGDAR